MAQRTDGFGFEKKGKSKKEGIYPNLPTDDSEGSDEADSSLYTARSERSDLNSTFEVEVEKSFESDSGSPAYNLRSRKPLHPSDSVEKGKGSSKKSRTPTTSPCMTGSPTLSPKINPDHKQSTSPYSPKYSPKPGNRSFGSSSFRESPSCRESRRTTYSSTRANERPSEGADNKSALCLVCVVLFLAFFGLWFGWPAKKAAEQQTTEDVPTHFKREFTDLKQKFPNQSDRFWKTLKASVKRVLTEKSNQPAVLLFSSVDSNIITSNCIAKHFGDLITRVFKAEDPIKITCSKSDGIKLLMDRRLISGFGSGSKVALISDLEEIPAEPAMLFHAYCDNENAPYKNVAVIFTLHLQNRQDIPQPPSGDAVVEDFLDEMWSDMDVNDRRALISRIANNVVVAVGEDAAVLNKHCV